MKAKGCKVDLAHNEPGFTLPSNIGELGDDITRLDLRDLRGAMIEPRKPIQLTVSPAFSSAVTDEQKRKFATELPNCKVTWDHDSEEDY